MCGIIGYVGAKEVYALLLRGLEQLEYRGYDSAGIATIEENKIYLHKVQGRVANLKTRSLPGKIGIGHTRWATHGQPSDRNAHPFQDYSHNFVVVHNGIIENYLELKEKLRQEGVNFHSETDSEVIVHLIAKNYKNNLREAVLQTLKQLQGSYALCVLKNDTKEMIGARNGSPLLVGLGSGENFLASDASAVIEHTKKVVYLDDFQMAEVKAEEVKVFDFAGKELVLKIKNIDWNLEQAQKQGYKHFMHKEIFEQPQVLKDSLGINLNLKLLQKKYSRIIIVACGTASYAGLVGKYLVENLAKIPVINEIASEFRYKDPLLTAKDLVIAISQSGETADTLAAVRLAKEKGAKTLGLINVVDSTIARETDEVIYTRAGPEIGVASTKAFTSQLVVLYKLAYLLAGKELQLDLGAKMLSVLDQSNLIRELAQKNYHYPNFLYIGRHLNYPLAMEGALKLKEISYIHAEGYPAGELKHGPIALVSDETPTIALCPLDSVYEKTLSNIEEVKARNGKVIAIGTQGDEHLKKICDEVIYLPQVEEIFYPLLMALALQLFAYHMADFRECDIDKPRNLAKSVTVE